MRRWLQRLRKWRVFESLSVHDSAVYTIGNYWTTAMQAAANIASRTVVEVAAFGANSYSQAVYSYLDRYNSVLRLTVDREVPRLQGMGEDREMREVIAGAYTALSASVFLESLALVLVAFFLTSQYMQVAFGSLALINVFGSLANVDQIILKATNRFNELAVVNIGTGTVGALATVGAALQFGFLGFFAGLVVLALLRYVASRYFMIVSTGLRPSYTLDKSVLGRVYTVGLPIMFFGFLQGSIFAVDRFFVEGFLDLEALGLYSLAAMGLGLAKVLPQSAMGSYFPKFMRQIGAGQKELARKKAKKIQGLVGLVSAIGFAVGILLVDPIISWLLPEYLPASLTIKFLLVGAYVYTGCIIPYYAHLGTGTMRRAILMAAGGLLSAGLLDWYLVRFGIDGVAIATAVALTIYAGLITASAEVVLGVRGLLRQMVPGACLILSVLAVELYFVPALAGVMLLLAGGWFVWRQKRFFALS